MEILLAVVPSIVVGMITFYWERQQKKRDERTDGRAKLRKEESLLSLKVNMATAKIAKATAIAVKTGVANGEVTEAMEELEQVRKEYFEFMNRQAKEHILEK